MIKLSIDGVEAQVPRGSTILEAARMGGVKIPTLCYLKDRSAIASCRVCSVEVEGEAALVTSCNTKVREGMIVITESERVHNWRRASLELIATEHMQGLGLEHGCLDCIMNDDCELQAVCSELGVTLAGNSMLSKTEPLLNSNPFLSYNPNYCIGCQRCVGTCNSVVGNHALQAGKQGTRTSILAPFGKDWRLTKCESCGNCAQSCPTAALTLKRRLEYCKSKVQKVRTTCPHCGMGCQLDLIVKDGVLVDAEAAPGSSNTSLTCVKGRSASFAFVHSPDRICTPLIKNPQSGAFEEASWEDALDLVATKFSALKEEYGGKALAAFACSRSTNEDIYLFQKMARVVFETSNIDNCARVCHAPSVAGLAITLGSGAMTNTVADITQDAEVIMLVGSNPEEAHPVLGMKIRAAVQEGGTKLIVVDPRDIGLTQYADIHLKLRPGTNVAFGNGIVHILIREGLIDEEFIVQRTEGFEKLAERVKDYTPERVAEICNIDADDLVFAARLYGTANTAPIIYCLGVTEHSTGTEGVMALSNIAMVNGKLGRKGCGVNPIRGQNNVQGACDMGAVPTDFPGYQKVTNPEVAEKFEQAWGRSLVRSKGLHATEVFPAVLEGKIKGLFIFGEDLVRTDPDTAHVIKALEELEFLVMSELFMTETARYADVILPGRSYAEKEGTFTNTERRVQRVRKAVEGPKGPKLDTEVFTEIMNRMGYEQAFLSAAEIMDEIASLTPSYSGISHTRLDSKELNGKGLQWPCPSPEHPGTPIMHVQKFTRGLGTFSDAPYRAANELPDDEYPLVMSTGRILYHYNACAMTSRVEGLNQIAGSSFIELNSEDAKKYGISDGDQVKVFSRRGAIESTARVSQKTNPGETWMPFHFQDGNSNWLTNAALDDYCKVPEYKVCAVQICKVDQ